MTSVLDGCKIVNKAGEAVDLATLKDKYVGLYFSAHWCPPCKAFTPVLAEFYNDIVGKGNIEIVFISSDRDAAAFKSYFAEMPWLALDFENRDKKKEFCDEYGISGIPTLVLLKPDGTVSTKDGRSKVTAKEKDLSNWE